MTPADTPRPGDLPSINEPPRSSPAETPTGEHGAPLLPDGDLMAMTRAELNAYAAGRGIDSADEATKADVIALLKA